MTVKEGGEPKFAGPYQLDKLCPVLGPNYYEHLIHDKSNDNFEAWDLMMGIHSLAATIETLKKALDKKNGVGEKEIDTKDLYHMQIDP